MTRHNYKPSVGLASLSLLLGAHTAAAQPSIEAPTPIEAPQPAEPDVPAALQCRQTVACSDAGLCTEQQGACVATSNADCRASSRCRSLGLCRQRDGACVAKRHSQCRDAAICKEDGRCFAVAGECVAAKTSDCRRSTGCAERGLCEAMHGECVLVRASGMEPKSFTPKPRRRRQRDSSNMEIIVAPGVGVLTGEGSGLFDPTFNADVLVGGRFGYGSVAGRLRLSPFNPDVGDVSMWMVGISAMPALRPIKNKVVDVAIGANFGYFHLEASSAFGSGSLDGLQVGPWAAVMISPNHEDDSRFEFGVIVDWNALIGVSACVNDRCGGVDYQGEGVFTAGLALGYSFDIGHDAKKTNMGRGW